MANAPNRAADVLDVLPTTGMNVDGLDKAKGPTWLCNVLPKVGRYEVRGGWGTLAQFSTTMNSGGDLTHGYGRPLAARLQVTDSGARQVVSLHQLRAFTGQMSQWSRPDHPPTGNTVDSLIAMSVYDITTGRRAEHVFRQQTQWASDLPNVDLSTIKNQTLLHAQVQGVPSMAELADMLYVCLPDLGVWFYRPIDPVLIDQRVQDVTGFYPTGDSAFVERLVPTDGAFIGAGLTYYNSSTFPAPTCLCAFQNRMVYASGRKLYFSDVDRPDNILGNSFFQVPTELPITAVAAVKGVILAFTAEETWLYQPNDPSQTGLISGGTVYNLSRSIGCLSPASLCQVGSMVVFMDQRGIYSNDGGAGITKMSDPIDAWFSTPDQVQNPFTSFAIQVGTALPSGEQPRAWIDIQDQLKRATMAWDSQNQLLYISLADFGMVWSQDSGWSVQLWETMATVVGGQPKVGLQRRITNPIVLTHGGDAFLIGGPDEEGYIGSEGGRVFDRSVYVLALGRGGGLDRSSVAQEDLRRPSQIWQGDVFSAGASPAYYVMPPIRMPDGWRTLDRVTDRPVYLVPVFADSHLAKLTSQIDLRLTFNNNFWRPLLIDDNDAAVNFVLPPERLGSADGWDVEVYNVGVLDPAGNELRLTWDGSGAANTWTLWPNMLLQGDVPRPLIYVPMQRIAEDEELTVLSMQWALVQATMTLSDGGGTQDADVYIAQESLTYPQQNLGDNTHAQPVDWAIASALVGNGTVQAKARGTFVSMRSYGTATQRLVAGWPVGPYGSETASDYHDFSAQLTDFTPQDVGNDDNPNLIRNVPTPRLRMQLSGALTPAAKTGNNVARWSDLAQPNTGNLLVDDPATDTISTSEGVRGERFRVMLAGCINANGEGVQVETVKVLARQTGGLRRSGRRGLT